MVAVNAAKLSGTGSKTGRPVVLAGDYVLRDHVTTKPGCHWRVYLDGLDDQPLDEVSTDTSGSASTTADETGLDLRAYTIRVVATKCGAWTVSLRRP